jgi:large subunit ribosomal protein L13
MTTKTFRLSAHDIEDGWHVLDAADRPLGRLASEAARLLLGKHKPTYEPHLAMGDHVVVVNAERIALTGRKAKQKVYYRHTGYPGGIRERSFEQQMERDPTRVIERAVKGMLPHNVRGRALLRRLKVYVGPDHPHEAQFNAGTGERARKRALREAAAAEAARATVEVADVVEDVVQAEVEAPAPATAVAEPVAEALEPAVEATEIASAGDTEAERLEGSLNKYRRAELDAEAERLGIEIDPDWNKPDVVEAVRAYYESNPVEAE